MLAVARASPRMVRTVRVGLRVRFFSTNVEKYREGVSPRTKFRGAKRQESIDNSGWEESVRFSEKIKTAVGEPIRTPFYGLLLYLSSAAVIVIASTSAEHKKQHEYQNDKCHIAHEFSFAL
jgi:hypothetical protein